MKINVFIKYLFFIILVSFQTFVYSQITIGSIDSAIVFGSYQLKNVLQEMNYDQTLHPNQTEPLTGEWEYSSRTWWTSGFFSGCAWYMYELTNRDSFWLDTAIKWTSDLETQKLDVSSHDVGFQIYCSYGNGHKITQNEDYKDVIITAANSLASRYDETIGSIRSWSWGSWNYPVIIDNMMNLEILLWASENGGSEELKTIAINHANKTMSNHIREDGSTYHVIDYNNDGTIKAYDTHQGYNIESTWSRGQAWGIYGFTVMYRFTKNETYLEVAKKLGNYFINNIPNDFVPYSDFEDPNIPNVSKDASAAAIVCSAFFELSEYVDDEQYKSTAISILESLVTNYLSQNSIYHSVIKRGCVRSGDPERGLIYADYYFLEALLRYRNTITNIQKDRSLLNLNFKLYQNYPNPFNPSTTIKYSISNIEPLNMMSVQLKIYNILGKEVATLVDEEKKPGNYQVCFETTNYASGVYYYQITSNNYSQTKKMVLLQ